MELDNRKLFSNTTRAVFYQARLIDIKLKSDFILTTHLLIVDCELLLAKVYFP